MWLKTATKQHVMTFFLSFSTPFSLRASSSRRADTGDRERKKGKKPPCLPNPVGNRGLAWGIAGEARREEAGLHSGSKTCRITRVTELLQRSNGHGAWTSLGDCRVPWRDIDGGLWARGVSLGTCPVGRYEYGRTLKQA